MTPDMKPRFRTEEEIGRLVRAAEEYGDVDGYAGKRQNSRCQEGMQLEVKPTLDRSASVWAVTMHNVSDGGVSFWSRRELNIGDTIYIREFTPDNAAPWLSARVRHKTSSLKGYLIGASFDTDETSKFIKTR